MNRLEKNAQRHGVLQRWARRTVLAAVIFSPWFFGSAEPWAYLFIALLVNIGVAIWLVSLFWEKRISPLPRGGQTVALLLVGYALVQLTPLPTSLVRAVNPMAAEARLTANDILQQVNLDSYEGKPEPPSSPERSLTLSISPQATRESLFLLLAYLGIFMVLTSTVNEWSKLRSAGYAIIASSFLMAVFAVVQKLSGTRAIYWFHLPRLGGVIFGPFTNRNHFAAHMNMAFGLAVGLIAMSRQWPAISDFHNWRSNLRKYTGMEVGQITLLLFSAVIIGSSICLSLSRGGMASLAASIGVAGFLISMQTRNAESRQRQPMRTSRHRARSGNRRATPPGRRGCYRAPR